MLVASLGHSDAQVSSAADAIVGTCCQHRQHSQSPTGLQPICADTHRLPATATRHAINAKHAVDLRRVRRKPKHQAVTQNTDPPGPGVDGTTSPTGPTETRPTRPANTRQHHRAAGHPSRRSSPTGSMPAKPTPVTADRPALVKPNRQLGGSDRLPAGRSGAGRPIGAGNTPSAFDLHAAGASPGKQNPGYRDRHPRGRKP